MKKFKEAKVSEVLDPSTGEIVTVETQKVFTEQIKVDRFYMTFIDYIAPVHKLGTGITRHLLEWMCEHAEYNTGKVLLNPDVRNAICSELNIKACQISTCIKKLKDSGIIVERGKGTYIINPKIFWKGELKKRSDFMEGKTLEISYTIK